MKRLFLASCIISLVAAPAWAQVQAHPYRVAFDLTSRDTLDQKAALRWIGEITGSSPAAEIEVVMYGKGFELVTSGRSLFAAQIAEVIKNPHVTFKVCEISLKNNGVEKSQLLPGVQTVPDGVYELVMKQQDRWGYIKVGH